jgi:hypothetical protein
MLRRAFDLNAVIKLTKKDMSHVYEKSITKQIDGRPTIYAEPVHP